MLKATSGSVCAWSVFVAAMLITADGAACGESLFRVGRGVPYRDYTAPIPGKILVVAVTEGERLIVERLAAAGHEIKVVEDPREIGDALAAGSFDIVMTHYEQREVVAAQMRESDARYLPVAREDTSEETDARALNRYAPNTGDSVKNFLKAINRTLRDATA